MKETVNSNLKVRVEGEKVSLKIDLENVGELEFFLSSEDIKRIAESLGYQVFK